MVVNKEQITKLQVKQNGKLLVSKILYDKALFDFDPSGGEITVLINWFRVHAYVLKNKWLLDE